MENNIKLRKCTKCNQHKEDNMFYNSVSFYCKPCAKEFSRERYNRIKSGEIFVIRKVKNREWYMFLESKGVKYCPSCDKVKPKDKFSASKDCKISGKRTYCKKCTSDKINQKIAQEKQENYDKYIQSEWYKNYMENKTKQLSENSKKAMGRLMNRMSTQKRKKFLNLPRYK